LVRAWLPPAVAAMMKLLALSESVTVPPPERVAPAAPICIEVNWAVLSMATVPVLLNSVEIVEVTALPLLTNVPALFTAAVLPVVWQL